AATRRRHRRPFSPAAPSRARPPTSEVSRLSWRLQLTVSDPCRTADRDREVGEEIPAHVTAADLAAQLGVVAEREPYDSCPVAVIRNPRRPLRHCEQRVEPKRDLAERAPRLAGARDLGFDRVLAAGRGDLDDASAREPELEAVHRPAVPLRWGKRDHAVHALLERRDANRSGGQFNFLVDQDLALGRARRGRTAVLQVGGPIAGTKAQIGPGSGGDADLAALDRVRETPLHDIQRLVVG